MKRLTTHTAVLAGLAVLAAFLAMYYVWGQEIPRQISNVILLGAAVTICMGWWPAAHNAFREGVSTGRQLIIVTIWLSWTSLMIQRVYTIINESLGRPDWLVYSPAPIVVATLIMISGIYAIIAPISDPEVLRREKVWDTMSIITGSVVACGAALIYYFFRVG